MMDPGFRRDDEGRGNDKKVRNDDLIDALSSPDFFSRLTATLNLFAAEKRLLARRFSAGAILGLMILEGERYVEPEAFQILLTSAMTALQYGRDAY